MLVLSRQARGGKRREITTQGNLDAHRIIDPVTGEIFRKALSQLPRITADDVVVNGAVAERPAKHMHTDLLLRDLASAVPQGISTQCREGSWKGGATC